MLIRSCAGGVVFSGNKVFLLKNDKGEWVLPKVVMKNGELPDEVALRKVKEEAGVSAEIVSPAGRTNYEFFSVTRQKPVCDKIIWYIMKSLEEKNMLNTTENMVSGGFFDVEEAISLINCSQDKSLLHLSFCKYRELA